MRSTNAHNDTAKCYGLVASSITIIGLIAFRFLVVMLRQWQCGLANNDTIARIIIIHTAMVEWLIFQHSNTRAIERQPNEHATSSSSTAVSSAVYFFLLALYLHINIQLPT